MLISFSEQMPFKSCIIWLNVITLRYFFHHLICALIIKFSSMKKKTGLSLLPSNGKFTHLLRRKFQIRNCTSWTCAVTAPNNVIVRNNSERVITDRIRDFSQITRTLCQWVHEASSCLTILHGRGIFSEGIIYVNYDCMSIQALKVNME